MNRVITINLNGVAYQLEESGYEALHEYLENAAHRLEGNPDKDEIIADIEQAIADKFRVLLGPHKTVVNTKEVAAVIAEMGPVQDDSGPTPQPAGGAGDARPAGAAASGSTDEAAGPVHRRLFKIQEGAMLAGVCNGLAAHVGIDVTVVRVAFVALTVLWGFGLLVYVALAFIMPTATTPAEKAAAAGAAATAQEFIKRARAGYYEGMRTFGDKRAHREWRRKFKQDMRGWKHSFRQEMRENSRQWQSNWQQHWGTHPRPFEAMLLWPFLSLFPLAVTLVMIFAILSLVGYGHIFGLGLPVGVPLWIGVVFLIVVAHLLTWPIKAYRRAMWGWGPGYYRYSGPMGGLWSSFVWLGFAVAAVWLADHYSPQIHTWLTDLPATIHHFLDSAREWWNRR